MLTSSDLVWMYEKMLLLREAEEKAVELSFKGEIGTLLSGSGQEAIPVGICKNLLPEDHYAPSHRGISTVLAKGGDPKYLFAELFGKPAGFCKGKGGEMHIADFKNGMIGMNGIVGAGIPLATGSAFAQKMKNLNTVTVCTFGDGASNQGVFHESLNMASIWKLPIVYVCENNQYAMTTPVSYALSVENISDRAKSYSIPGVTVDGNDVLAVYEAVNEAVERARKGEGPTLVECKTYRKYGHHAGAGNDEQMGWGYRPKAEEAFWKSRDPILLFEDYLMAKAVLTEGRIKLVREKIKKEIEEAVEFARKAENPKPEDALEDLFA